MDAERDDALENLCIRCRDADVDEPGGYCLACTIESRLECATGLGRLTEYLSAWAAFGEWLATHGRDPAPV